MNGGALSTAQAVVKLGLGGDFAATARRGCGDGLVLCRGRDGEEERRLNYASSSVSQFSFLSPSFILLLTRDVCCGERRLESYGVDDTVMIWWSWGRRRGFMRKRRRLEWVEAVVTMVMVVLVNRGMLGLQITIAMVCDCDCRFAMDGSEGAGKPQFGRGVLDLSTGWPGLL
ncbi:hypothetical protein M0R45_029932 [Rubus argutus]|uniref:Uncharacterized protein n=1 Tax=Rubus argutus TaxID=59490 RepID=A0AAW1WBH8_RUBAR